METVSANIIELLEYLLPGFVAAWIFYALTSYRKPSQFERVVQALIFTIFIQSAIFLLEELSAVICDKLEIEPFQAADVTWSVFISVLIGLAFSFFANNDYFHAALRFLRITKESSYPSEWYSAFTEPSYVVLHLQDERRVHGWPREWPSSPDSGHFLLNEPCWLSGTELIPIANVEHLVVSVHDVRWLEYMDDSWKNNLELEKPNNLWRRLICQGKPQTHRHQDQNPQEMEFREG
ncbi:DUF6338 family protein [Salinivibrio kushneri]|uniref:Uncharacterized protein n=1 Tax=Salinivibrio kushneri TaxID=1908198 RepID=A0AB36K849_9GAMM|nr:DUF6338 family protein [Salinivibrio kushneri]OOE45094.1 hypothetical protein BZG09_05155 [Salinivibrio kushneri]